MAPSRRARVLTAATITWLLIVSCIWVSLSWNRDSFKLWEFWSFPSSDHHGGSDGTYVLGVGKADITGPVVELNLMGYADPKQVGTGLQQRLYSRAFIVGDSDNPGDCFVYLVLDIQSGDTAIRHGILEGLRELGPEYSVYGQHNVAVTGTHSHSGPGAWLNYLLPQVTSKGFDKQSYHAIVDGTVMSIKRAHESRALGRLSVGNTRVKDANINRSLYAYLANPKAERDRYEDDVDKTMTLLRFQRASDGHDIGVLTWFPVHGTSMLGNNTLITGDNKGVAANLFETVVESDHSNIAPGFVAGFSQSNVGDTSPNVLGAYCEDGSGEQCRLEDSTCGGRSQGCHGRGPYFGLDDGGTKSCFEIGRRQYQAAFDLFNAMQNETRSEGGEYPSVDLLSRSASEFIPIIGGVGALHSFESLANYTFVLPNGTTVSTCSAALGYSFAAGTSDGPGAFDFRQNSTGGNVFWDTVRNVIHTPTEEQKACQAPKPILLDVGETKAPYDWAPNIVDIQLLRVGQLVIIVSPGEATTMAGRRWKEAVASSVKSFGHLSVLGRTTEADTEPIVVLGGPANTYTHYIATEEEYRVQRYEGASTLYGPHTLAAYMNLTLEYLPSLWSNPKTHGGRHPDVDSPNPPINTNRSLSFITPVVVDHPGLFHGFGDVLEDVKPEYMHDETISVKFVGANPRNDLRLEATYAAVEQYICQDEGLGATDCSWDRIRDDADWDLQFEWKRTNEVLGTSEVTVSWDIDSMEGVGWRPVEGKFRIRYWGAEKSLLGPIHAFEATSGEFLVKRRG